MAKGKKSKVWYEVTCPIHGSKEASDNTGTPRVKVSAPDNKRERMSGCPMCKLQTK